MPFIPPIGIPDPAASFGVFDPIDTANPVAATYAPGWFEGPPRVNSIAAGDAHNCYYIDNSDPAATDTANTYGHPDLPRLTIPTTVLAAGSYVEIHGDGATGAYKYSVMRPAGIGTAALPIWFVGVNSPIISGTLDIGFYSANPTYSYIVFDGLFVRDGGEISIRPRYNNHNMDHIVVRNCDVRGTQTTADGNGISIGRSGHTLTNSALSDMVVYNTDIYNFGDPVAPGEECGFYPSFYVTRMWLLDCDIHNNAEDGVAGSHGGKRTTTDFYVGRCTVHDNVTNGFDYKQLGRAVISQCEVYGHYAATPFSTGTGANLVLHYSGNSTPGSEPDAWKNYPEDVSVLFCEIHDADFGVVSSHIDKLRIIGCVFYAIQHSETPWDPTSAYATGAAIHLRGLHRNTWVAHNTIYDCDSGLQWPDTGADYAGGTIYYRGHVVYYGGKLYHCFNDNANAGISGFVPTNLTYWEELRLQVWGNIINARAEPTGRDLYISVLRNGDGAVDMDYNLLPSSASISYGSSTVRDLAWLIANTPHQDHAVSAPPLFINPPTDFTLQSGSPAIDIATEGTGTNAYDDFFVVHAIAIEVDNAGVVRPQGPAWDMGAFEYEDAVVITQPNPPTNVRFA